MLLNARARQEGVSASLLIDIIIRQYVSEETVIEAEENLDGFRVLPKEYRASKNYRTVVL